MQEAYKFAVIVHPTCKTSVLAVPMSPILRNIKSKSSTLRVFLSRWMIPLKVLALAIIYSLGLLSSTTAYFSYNYKHGYFLYFLMNFTMGPKERLSKFHQETESMNSRRWHLIFYHNRSFLFLFFFFLILLALCVGPGGHFGLEGCS